MKRVIFPVIILCAALFVVIGCSNEKAIEKTIDDWTSAVNGADPDAMGDAVSPDSEMYDPFLIENFITYFSAFDPVSYDLIEINIDAPLADVPADASYRGVPNAAKFVMKKKQGFFSFLAPEWKVYKYFDNGNLAPGDELWKRLKKQP